MKNIRYISYAAVGLLATAITSCEKQLKEYNPGNPTAEEVWTTPQGFVTNVNAAYYEQRYWYGKEDGMFMAESGTDLWFNQNKNTYARQFSKYDGLVSTTGYIPNTWQRFWSSINLCNAGIERIDKAGFTDEVEKKKRLGELYFLRAFYYWHVVEQWGNVMLRTQETKGIELTAQRSTIEALYNLMIDDLLKAKDYLPINWPAAEFSRASRKSAMGLLARVYLTRASYATGTEATTWFTKARDAAKEVIDKKNELGTDLWSSYADLWKPANNKNNLQKEGLYIISNSSTNQASNYDPTEANRLHSFYMCLYSDKPGLTRSIPYGFDGNMKLMPTLSLLNMYNEDQDTRYEVSFKETFAANVNYVWSAADITKYGKVGVPAGTTISTGNTAFVVTKKVRADKTTVPYVVFDRNDIYKPDGTITDDAVKNKCFPVLQKFIDPSRTLVDGQAGYNDIMAIRLAEMYLIAAEAEFRLGNNAAAADYVNVLRVRAARKTPTDYSNAMRVTAADITVDFLLDERARELCGEQLRWFDLKRMLPPAAWITRIKTYNPDITLVQEFHRLRPIPQKELDALSNSAEFGQNLGY